MEKLIQALYKLRIWKDTCGQDLIEYALMVGFVAVAGGAIIPGAGASITAIYTKVLSVLNSSAG